MFLLVSFGNQIKPHSDFLKYTDEMKYTKIFLEKRSITMFDLNVCVDFGKQIVKKYREKGDSEESADFILSQNFIVNRTVLAFMVAQKHPEIAEVYNQILDSQINLTKGSRDDFYELLANDTKKLNEHLSDELRSDIDYMILSSAHTSFMLRGAQGYDKLVVDLLVKVIAANPQTPSEESAQELLCSILWFSDYENYRELLEKAL